MFYFIFWFFKFFCLLYFSFFISIVLIFNFFWKLLFYSGVYFFFHFLSFRFLKWNQMNTTWPRIDIAPKINLNGREMTYAWAAAVCYIKRCKKFIFFTCSTWKFVKNILLFIKKYGIRPALFSCYYHLKRPSQKLIFYIMIFE